MSDKSSDRLKPIFLYPLTPEQALSAFMKVDPVLDIGHRKDVYK